MRSILHERLRVLPLNEKYDLTMFFSTNNELNDFLKNDALNSQDVLISRTTCAIMRRLLSVFLHWLLAKVLIFKP